jgi:hypothetical protein
VHAVAGRVVKFREIRELPEQTDAISHPKEDNRLWNFDRTIVDPTGQNAFRDPWSRPP